MSLSKIQPFLLLCVYCVFRLVTSGSFFAPHCVFCRNGRPQTNRKKGRCELHSRTQLYPLRIPAHAKKKSAQRRFRRQLTTTALLSFFREKEMDGANGFLVVEMGDPFSRIPLPTSELHVCPHTQNERKRNGGKRGGEVNAAKDLLSFFWHSAVKKGKEEESGFFGNVTLCSFLVLSFQTGDAGNEKARFFLKLFLLQGATYRPGTSQTTYLFAPSLSKNVSPFCLSSIRTSFLAHKLAVLIGSFLPLDREERMSQIAKKRRIVFFPHRQTCTRDPLRFPTEAASPPSKIASSGGGRRRNGPLSFPLFSSRLRAAKNSRGSLLFQKVLE